MKKRWLLIGALGGMVFSAAGGFYSGLMYFEASIIAGGQYVHGLKEMPPVPPISEPDIIGDNCPPPSPRDVAENDIEHYCYVVTAATGKKLNECRYFINEARK